MSVNSLRRYYLLKWRIALQRDDPNAPNWKSKHEGVSATELPEAFPSRALLVAAGYTAREDLTGATMDELMALGLAQRQAAAVLAAL